jgi:hypothetical protein
MADDKLMSDEELRAAFEDGSLELEDIPLMIESITKKVQEECAKDIVKAMHKVFTGGRMVGIAETIREFQEMLEKKAKADANVSYGGTA